MDPHYCLTYDNRSHFLAENIPGKFAGWGEGRCPPELLRVQRYLHSSIPALLSLFDHLHPRFAQTQRVHRPFSRTWTPGTLSLPPYCLAVRLKLDRDFLPSGDLARMQILIQSVWGWGLTVSLSD